MKTIKSYIKPSVKVVSFRVEGGFQAYRLSHSVIEGDMFNSNNQENWSPGGNLFDGWGTATSSE